MSGNPDASFYITVKESESNCPSTGPFFPQSSRYMNLLRVQLDENTSLEPDWLNYSLIFVILMLILVVLVILATLFKKYGWTKWLYTSGFYRTFNSLINFDLFSSKGSKTGDKKLPKDLVESDSKIEEIESSKYWDFGQNVDLEDFDAQRVYRILMDQSVNLVSGLDKQREEAKGLVERFRGDVDELKAGWARSLNVDDMSIFASPEEISRYQNLKVVLGNEIQRRQKLGTLMSTIYRELSSHLSAKTSSVRDILVEFGSRFEQINSLLSNVTSKLATLDSSQFDNLRALNNLISFNITDLYETFDKFYAQCKTKTMTDELKGSCLAVLESSSLLSKKYRRATDEDIFDEVGGFKVDFLTKDSLTGLILVAENTKVYDGDTLVEIETAGTHFFHPQTKRVHPIEGNVCYSTDLHRFVVTIDYGVAFSEDSESQFIPYIPYPKDKRVTYLDLTNEDDLRFGGRLVDPKTGLAVPVLCLTIDPTNQMLCPIGGTFESEITKLLTPIELGLVQSMLKVTTVT